MKPFIYLIFLVSLFTPNVYAKKPAIQHSVNYHNNLDIRQYWVSEKLDGVRGYWSGQQMYTRQGNPINLPKGYSDNWPSVPFDGELWHSRGGFQKTVSCVRKKIPEPSCWREIEFRVFDLPKSKANFTQRLNQIKQLLNNAPSKTIKMVEQFSINSEEELFSMLDQIVALGGEGLMLHSKNAYYKPGRNKALLKLKPYQDEEGVVLKHISGKGKYKNMLGALLVKNKDGLVFKIGSGFSDKERRTPPPIGSEITYKYIGKTDRGVPRFASFLRNKQ
ncbi:DNA ligase [Thalassotalea piscium]|uniref:DNA ligase-1 n=1 Tax=Thalassotalea piscium TaxID=1230533 RepID=A0A7X0NID9_9GAMM|nr:DNA ligase [Thalassotalea piscium]MBB6543861.1 DNA ligase-1 [Thalassotalea piscium]